MEPSPRTAEVLGRTNIHLDFHTPRFQREVGVDFDAERFARRLEEANVDSIALFAKCCHGYSYYDTDVGTRHPHLDFDLFAKQIEACRERDIAVLAYYVLAWDYLPGPENPDWYQRDADGDPLRATVADPETALDRWDWLCLNSPYVEEVIHPQVAEILEYDIDGFFFDILQYHPDACACRYCSRSMASEGLDPDDADDRRSHRNRVARDFVARTTRLIKGRDEDLVLTYNHSEDVGLTGDLARHMDYAMVESHAASWDHYLHTPLYARYIRNFDRPVQMMNAAFHEFWGDFGTVKNESQLRYELALSVANHLPVSVGDQLLPRGELEPHKYDVIGEVFGGIVDLDLPPAEPLRDVAVVFPGDTDVARSPGVESNGAVGATKLLCETHQQFDVLDERLARELLDEFEVAILPGSGALAPETVEAIRSFVADGGRLLATGDSSLDGHGFALADVLGVRRRGQLPYSTAYFGLDNYDEDVAELPDGPCVSYGPFQAVILDGAAELARVVAPTTERSETRRFSHFQAPPERALDVPAITHHAFGDGEALYVGTDLFRQYFDRDYHGHGALLAALVERLQREDGRVLDADAPASLEVNAMRTADATYLHLINFHSSRAGSSLARIGEIPPLRDVSVSVKCPAGKVTSPTGAATTARRDGEYVRVDVDAADTYEIVRVEDA